MFLLSSSSERPPDARRRSLKNKINKVNPYSNSLLNNTSLEIYTASFTWGKTDEMHPDRSKKFNM